MKQIFRIFAAVAVMAAVAGCYNDFDTPQPERRFIGKLVDIMALFTRCFFIGTGTIEHVNPLGPLDKPIEIVGIDPFMVRRRRQVERRPQIAGDERRLGYLVARKIVVVHREQDHIAEIEVARFEDTHDLQPFERFALKGDSHGLQVPPQQGGIG